jgi:hypothetical protein
MTGRSTHPMPPPRPVAVAPWAVTCAALAVSAALLATEPARTKAASGASLQAAKWAAEPSAPVIVAVAPAVADPIQPHGFFAAPRLARPALAAEIATVRQAARTRWGGRCGP